VQKCASCICTCTAQTTAAYHVLHRRGGPFEHKYRCVHPRPTHRYTQHGHPSPGTHPGQHTTSLKKLRRFIHCNLHVQTPNLQLRRLSVTLGPVPGHNTWPVNATDDAAPRASPRHSPPDHMQMQNRAEALQSEWDTCQGGTCKGTPRQDTQGKKRRERARVPQRKLRR
jgi:hypothetical protein